MCDHYFNGDFPPVVTGFYCESQLQCLSVAKAGKENLSRTKGEGIFLELREIFSYLVAAQKPQRSSNVSL